MSESRYTVLTDLRQATRFEREYGAEEVVIWTASGDEKLGCVRDESLGGLGLYLDDVQGLDRECEVTVVYAGELLAGTVRHIEPQTDRGYVVGLECSTLAKHADSTGR